MAKGINIPLTISGLREAREEIVKLNQEIEKLDENTEDYAAESQRLNEALSQQTQSVKQLEGELESVTKKGNSLAKTLKNLKGVSGGIKESFIGLKDSLFKLDFKGVKNGVKGLGSQFKIFGRILLANPIFLIVAIVAAIVIAIIKFKDKVKILSVAFEFFGKVIGVIIQSLKDLLDWLGLTEFAEQDQAEERKKRAEENLKNIEKQAAAEQSSFDRKIALAAAEGKSTYELEQMKQKAIIETTRARNRELAAMREAEKVAGTYTKERQEEFNKLIAANNETVKNASNQLKINEINNSNKIKNAEASNLKERQAKYKAYAKSREDAAKLLQDLELQLMEEGTEKEIATINLKYDRLIEGTKNNESMLQAEKEKVIKYYESLRALEEGKILAAKKQTEEQQAAAQAKFLLDAQNAQLDLIEQFQEEAYQLGLEDREREDEALRTKYEERLSLARQFNQDTLAIEEAYEKEKAAMEDKYRKQELKREQDLENAKLSLVSGGLSAVSQLTELFAGKNEKAAKRAFAVQKAVSISQAIIDTYKGANAIFASAAANPQSILFPAQPFIAAGIAITSGLANVAKIASAKFQGSSAGGGSAPSAPNFGGGGASSASTSTPSFELFGQPNQDNNVSAPQSQETTQMTVKAVVVESDITSTQNKIEKMQKNAEL